MKIREKINENQPTNCTRINNIVMKKKEKIIGEIGQREGRSAKEERRGNRNEKIVYSTYDHTQL